MVHTVFCTTSTEQRNIKTTLKPLFFYSNLAFAVKQQRPDYYTKPKNQKTLIVHFGGFGVLMLVLFQQFTGDV